MASDETSGVMMAYYMMAILRMGGVLASRRELQDRGVLELDCPVCLGQLDGRKGLVTFHVLECGHRCEAARTGSFPAGDDAKVGHLPPSPPPHPPFACVAGSTRNACSKSRGRQMPPAALCAGARSAVARHAPGTALW